MKMQGKNVAHAAIADDLFLQRQFLQGSDWLGGEAIGLEGKRLAWRGSDWLGGEAVINKCNKCRLGTVLD